MQFAADCLSLRKIACVESDFYILESSFLSLPVRHWLWFVFSLGLVARLERLHVISRDMLP